MSMSNINKESIKEVINKHFNTLEGKVDNILKLNDDYYPSNLYHRTNYYTNVGNILLKKKLIPSCLLTKKETYCATMSFNFVSLTEGKCNLTGGNIQIVFYAKRLLEKNNIEPIYKEMKSNDLFIHELEWRNKGIVNFDYSDIKEIILYKNYSPFYNIIPEEKRRLTIADNNLRKITQRYNINYRVIDYDSNDCNKKDRLQELEKILGKDIADKVMIYKEWK